MKIRNLSIYLKKITSRKNIEGIDYWPVANLVREEEDTLLEFLYTIDKTNLHKFKNSTLTDLTSFANDSNTQIFQELAQNARNSNAEKLWIFFKKDEGVLIINNGDAFHTIPKNDDGSLYSFLGKEKGVNYDNENKSGKYGKGSKLIYNLLIPKNHKDGSTKDQGKRLAIKMIDKLQAPILFSWTKGSQLSDLLRHQNISQLEKETDLDEKSAILCMLMMSYFPLLPNQEITIGEDNSRKNPFDNNAFLKFISNIKSATDSIKGEKLFMSPGSLIFIPAQNDVISELLLDEEGIKKDLSQIVDVLSKDENINFNDIFVNGERLLKDDSNLYSFDVQTPDEKHKVNLIFPSSAEQAHTKRINFFTDYFPISKEKHGFSYLVSCKGFNPGSNREKLEGSNKNLIEWIGKTIIDKWNTIIGDEIKYSSWISALVISNNNIEEGMINSFHSKLIGKAKSLVPTNNNSIKAPNNKIVVLPNGFENLKLSDFGIDKFGLNTNLYNYKDYFKENWEIKELSITQVFRQSDENKLKLYLSNCKYSELRRIWKQLEIEDSLDSLLKTPIIPTTNNKWFSLYDFIVKDDLFFTGNNGMFNSILATLKKNNINVNNGYSSFDPINVEVFPNFNKFFNKYWKREIIEKRLSYLFENKQIKLEDKEKLSLINQLYNLDNDYKDFIRNKFKIFKDVKGNVKTLSKLISPNIGIAKNLLNNWMINDGLRNNLTLKLSIEENKIWELINADKPRLQYEVQIDNNPESLATRLLDLYEVYKKRETLNSIKLVSDSKYLLSRESKWVSFDKVLLFKRFSTLKNDDYEIISKFFERNGYTMLSWNKFFLETVINTNIYSSLLFCNNLNNWIPEKVDITEQELSILLKEDSIFFNNFILENNKEDSFLISSGGNKQFKSQYNDYAKFLTSNGYFQLPDSFKQINWTNRGLINADSELFIIEMINKFGSQQEFISIVAQSSNNVKTLYFSKIEQVNISINENYNEEQFETKLFNIAFLDTTGRLSERLKSIILIDGSKLDESNLSEDVTINEHTYKLVQLIPSDKNKIGISSSVISALAKVNDQVKLEKIFKLREKELVEVYSDVINKSLSYNNNHEAFRLSFLIDYNLESESFLDKVKAYFSNKITTQLEIETILNVFENYKQYKFYNYWPNDTHLFKPDRQIIPNNKLLWSEIEVVPAIVEEWSRKNEDNKKFIIKSLKLNHKVEPTESARIEIKEKGKVTDDFKRLLEQNIIWVKNGEYLIIYGDSQKLLRYLEEEDLYDKYLLVYDSWRVKNQKIKISNSAKYYTNQNLTYKEHLSDSIIKGKDVAIINSNIKDKIVEKHSLKELLIEKEFSESMTNSTEWDNDIYKRWKNINEKLFYTINLVDGKVPFLYKINLDGSFYKDIKTIETDDIGRNKKYDTVNLYLNIDNAINEETIILPFIEDNQVGLFVNESETRDYANLLNSFLPHNRILKNETSVNTRKGNGNLNIKGADKLIDKEKLEKALSTLLEDNGENDIIERLNSKPKKEEKKEKSQISLLSGTIGESLMEEWLKVKYNKVDNIANDRKPYDLLLNEDTEIEVKTRSGTQYDKEGKSESTVIYMRKSQINHIEGEKYKKDYLLVLISLKDLGYYPQYKKWRDEYKEKIGGNNLPNELENKIKEFAKKEMNKPDNSNKFERELHVINMKGAKKEITG